MALKDGFSLEEFVSLVDNIYDEICIWDADSRMVYINNACARHYGLKPEDFIGKKLTEMVGVDKLWYPSCVPDTANEKRPVIQQQKTILGQDIFTISVPIYDEAGDTKYILQSVRESYDYLYRELSPLRGVQPPESGGSQMVYRSEAMAEVTRYAQKLAATKAPILILGETGTGKSYLAKYIHQHSDRRDKPLVTINMASLSPSVVEAEFFGYTDGAFTGAKKGGKKGLLEAANGGTLFLDEIGDFPYELQAKFLHVLQEEEFTPVGGVKPIHLDFRLICATNCNLQKMIEAGKFRKDLYHRINMLEITVPPLRKRREDIRPLAEHFLESANRKYDRKVRISDEVWEAFSHYLWSGNIRELSNVIELGVLMAEADDQITMRVLPESFFSMDHVKRAPECQMPGKSLEEIMDHYEKGVIETAYRQHPSSRKLAEALRISQATASRLIRKYIKNGDSGQGEPPGED